MNRKKYSLFAALIMVLILTACGNKREEMLSEKEAAVTGPVSTETMEQTETASSLQIEPVTVEGYYFLTNEPIRVTIGVERVLQGEEAYRELLAQNAQCPPPDDGQEYILVTVNMKYEDGEADSINLYEERHASLGAARVFFNIPNEAGNSVDATSYLTNPIWGQDPIVGRTVVKGESVSGDIAFLVEEGNTQPLYFVGYNQVVEFQIHLPAGSELETDEPKPEWDDASQSATVTNSAEHEDGSLFDALFVPAAQGKIGADLEEFKMEAAERGFDCIEEAGILLVQDPNSSECFLRCELARSDNEQIKVSKLVYNCSLGAVERQVTAAGIDAGQIAYYVGTSAFSEGTQVSSLEDVKQYLNAEISPEETATGAPETALGLFDNVLVPLAEGSLLNQANAFKKVLEQYGYIYKDGEGLFTVYDPEHPDNYLFGGNSLLQDTDTISTLGFCMETETSTKKAEVYFFTSEPKYYTYNGDFTQVEVDSFEQIKEYIAQE